MFFSLIQTLVCVLLVNGGLYALHLTGNANGNSNGNGPLSLQQQKNAHVSSGSSSGSHSKSPLQMPAQRLSEELADLAQLERERLMVMGLAKQTAEESGYHGRPIITGRIKMHPVEDIDSDYSAWLQQQARNVMFGNVVKHPHTELNDEQDYDTGGGGGGVSSSLYGPHLRPSQYEYGRVVQPADKEFENPHNLDLDDFMELESVADEEELFPDLDGYAYLDELIADGNKERMQQHMPQFPGFRHAQQQQQLQSHHSYVNRHEPQTLQELFEKEQEAAKQTHNKQQQQLQQQQQQQQQQQHNMEQVNQFNQKYRNNIRLQQKWQRKRNQLNQQQSLPRNIFGQKTKQPQLHHFKIQSTNKLSLANSEATATSKVNKAHNSAQALLASPNKAEAKNSDTSAAAASSSSSSSSSSSASSSSNSNASSPQKDSAKKTAQLQIEENQILHPNRKRSGMAAAGSMQTPNLQSPHSLASQLMLRTARGQRQYDVPQIECPTAMDGMERFACPTPDVQGRYRCIDDHVLCDGFIDCPEGEDEDRRSCMFYKTTKAHLDVLADALLRWARGR